MISSPDLSHEKKLWLAYKYIAGLDEAGRGALAGPVCVGVVICLMTTRISCGP